MSRLTLVYIHGHHELVKIRELSQLNKTRGVLQTSNKSHGHLLKQLQTAAVDG